MKKIVVLMVLAVFAVSFAYAQTDTDPMEDDYRNLQLLSSKIRRMKREMDKFMKGILAAYPEQEGALSQDFGQDVKVDISENDKDVIVRADLPGMEKDKINVTLEKNRTLRISGSREIMKKETAPGMVRQERSYGRFERILELPVDCMNSGIKATYTNGVLEIIVPKKKASREEPIKIKVQ